MRALRRDAQDVALEDALHGTARRRMHKCCPYTRDIKGIADMGMMLDRDLLNKLERRVGRRGGKRGEGGALCRRACSTKHAAE